MSNEIKRTLISTPVHTITIRNQRFLDAEKVMPLGVITAFIGRGGSGKTAFAFDIVAKLSNGTLLGDYEGSPQVVLIIAPEDDNSTQIAPRLIAAGANLENVRIVEMKNDDGEGYAWFESPNLERDLKHLTEKVQEEGAKLIVFDPIMASMNADTNKAKDVRSELGKLDAMAKQLDIGVIAIQHVRKGNGGDLADRASGSHAFRDVVRSSLHFAKDDDTGNIVATVDKDNYSGLGGTSWSFTLEPVTVTDDEGNTADTIKVKHFGRSDISVHDIMKRDRDEGQSMSRRDEAEEWLRSFVGIFEGRPYSEIIAAGKAEGFSESTLKRAGDQICIKHREHTYQGGSWWELKPTN